MPTTAYRSVAFRPASLAIIAQANAIAADYGRQGYSLTLRQLYYRFVAKDLIPNTVQSYKRLGSIINDARYAGMFDWDWLTDRTRNATGGDGGYSPDHPEEVIEPGVFSVTQWEGQPHRVEVWVEKDALIDVVQRAAGGYRATTFSCRGYTSSSEIWAAAQRLEGYYDTDGVEQVTILHLGDHDPSGIDMSRDIEDRLREFIEGDGYDSDWLTIERIALNMNQIRLYNPPPNPAKETDSRFASYTRRYGDESWELDALEPRILTGLIRDRIRPLIDTARWERRKQLTAAGQATLRSIRDNYPEVVRHLVAKNLMVEPVIEGEDE